MKAEIGTVLKLCEALNCGEIILVVRGGRIKFVDYHGRVPRMDDAETIKS